MIALRIENLIDVFAQEVTTRVVRVKGDLDAVVAPPALLVFFDQAQGVVLDADEEVEAIVRRRTPRHQNADVVVFLFNGLASGGEHALGREDKFLVQPVPIVFEPVDGHGAGVGHAWDEILSADVRVRRAD